MIETILITGTGGFIGKNLKRYFENKYKLLTPRSYELDCTSSSDVQDFFKNNKIDFIIHCGTVGGARGIEDKVTTIDENLCMVKNLLEYKNKNTRLILFSSGAMYDKSQPIKKAKENDLQHCFPKDLYGQSKKIITEYIKNRDDVTCLTIFACYGFDEKSSRFPSYAILQNLKHKKIEINQNIVFDYLYIEDLCKIVDSFILNKPKHNVINVTPTTSVDLKTIAETVNKISDYKSEITFKTPELGNEYTGNNEILLCELPNFQFTEIETGLKILYEYIKSSI